MFTIARQKRDARTVSWFRKSFSQSRVGAAFEESIKLGVCVGGQIAEWRIIYRGIRMRGPFVASNVGGEIQNDTKDSLVSSCCSHKTMYGKKKKRRC